MQSGGGAGQEPYADYAARSRPESIIVHRDLVIFLRNRSLSFDNVLYRERHPGGAVEQFPDGSLLIRGEVADGYARKAWETIGQVASFGKDVAQHATVRDLAGFGPYRRYRFLYLADYHERLGGNSGFLVIPVGLGQFVSKGEYELGALPVTVRFYSRVARDAMLAFRDTVERWSSSVSTCGVFGEGPARLLSAEIAFQGLFATFVIDASRSGQNTLNWLTLLVLGFGIETHPVRAIQYDSVDDVDGTKQPRNAPGQNLQNSNFPWRGTTAGGGRPANSRVAAEQLCSGDCSPPPQVLFRSFSSPRVLTMLLGGLCADGLFRCVAKYDPEGAVSSVDQRLADDR